MKKKSARNSSRISFSADLSDKTITVLLLLVAVVGIISVSLVYIQVLNTVSLKSPETAKTEFTPAETKGAVSIVIIAPPQKEAQKAP